VATDDVIDAILYCWMAKWRTTIDLAVGSSNFVAQRKKEEAKLKMAQLAEKRKKEATGKAHTEHDSTQQTQQQTKKTEHGFDKGVMFPSLEIKEETNKKIEQHDVDP